VQQQQLEGAGEDGDVDIRQAMVGDGGVDDEDEYYAYS
jgi:hypothetical protein